MHKWLLTLVRLIAPFDIETRIIDAPTIVDAFDYTEQDFYIRSIRFYGDNSA